jgi:hypothetical protein
MSPQGYGLRRLHTAQLRNRAESEECGSDQDHERVDSPQLTVEIPRRMVAGDYVVDEENLTGFILAGFSPEVHAVVVYRVQDGLIHDVVLLM